MIGNWHGPGGYKHVLSVGLPLVFSMISHTVMQFTDRIFLGNYSLDAIAASLPAGIASFLFLSFFMGVAEYVSVFVAQYTGAKVEERVGAVVWQGVYFCIIAGLILAGIGLSSNYIFALGGHSPEVQALEAIYFRILCFGGFFILTGVCLSCFYSGRGMTWPVAAVNAIGAAINIPLNYALINGEWGFPELGIAGAGIATVTSASVTMVLFAVLVFAPRNRERFGFAQGWRFDGELFRRFVRYGLPSGIQFFIDIFGITFFIFMLGRLGKMELAAANIVFSIELLAFLPLVGFSIATSVLVGQFIGAKTPEYGEIAARNATHLGLLCMGCAAMVFIFAPVPLLSLFKTKGMSAESFGEVIEMGTVLLRIVAAYCVIYAPAQIWFGGLKGAGDIRYVMWSMGISSLLVLILPTYFMVEYTHPDYYTPWFSMIAYSIALSLAAGIRFKAGKWKAMSVIVDSQPNQSSLSGL